MIRRKIMKIVKIQEELLKRGIDGWLFYDFHNRDLLAYSILGLDKDKLHTRRWYYFIPAKGECKKLVHSIESDVLDQLPGEKYIYLPWQQQQNLLKKILEGSKKIAMQYSPMNAIPYISIVDGGTIDLIRSFGVEVISSADLVQIFEACISKDAYESHREAGKLIHKILNLAWDEIKKRTIGKKKFTEYDIQQFMIEEFEKANLSWEDGAPIVAVNENAANPHYEPTESSSKVIKEGDLILIDLWAKLKKPGSIYYDITWVAALSGEIKREHREVFEIVKAARDLAVQYIGDKFERNECVYGWQVDDVVRNYISEKGYGKYFLHRTGHCIGTSVHGNGVNIDNLETKDERMLMPGILFSIEPGIYLKDFGIRSEINVYINEKGEIIVSGEKQEEIIRLL